MYFGNFTSNPWMIILLIFLIGDNLQNYINNPTALLGLVLSIPGIIIAITLHEYAHAWTADKLGDDTPRRQGRLTLNPFAHMDPIGIVLLLFAGFGWGKPVEINPNNFNRKVTVRQGSALVALAGPVMNFILAIIFSVIYGLLIRFTPSFVETDIGYIILEMVLYTIEMNVGLGVFNLIPLPPLDGSKVLIAILPQNARIWLEQHERILYIVFLIIWVTPIATYIISPLIGLVNNGLVQLIYAIIGTSRISGSSAI